jgi:hypothetical protein
MSIVRCPYGLCGSAQADDKAATRKIGQEAATEIRDEDDSVVAEARLAVSVKQISSDGA